MSTGANDGYEWRYLPAGRRTHAHYVSVTRTAICGTGVYWPGNAEEWRGTGSQDEYERAAELPRCARCTKLIRAGR